MPTQTYDLPFTNQHPVLPYDFKTWGIRLSLPYGQDCPAPPPPLLSGDGWNCSRCAGEPEFYMPFVGGDIIPFILPFEDYVNTNPALPTAGWQTSGGAGNTNYYIRASLLDCECNPIEGMGFADLFSANFFTTYSPKYGSLQYLEVDTALIPGGVCCFALKVDLMAPNPSNTGFVVLSSYTTEAYQRIDSASCLVCEPETVVLRSTYKRVDCYGRPYDFDLGGGLYYQNLARVQGTVEYLGQDVEVDEDDGVVLTRTMISRYRLVLAQLPPYMAELIATILHGDTVYIGDIKVKTIANFARNNEASRMFAPSIEFTTECELKTNVCD